MEGLTEEGMKKLHEELAKNLPEATLDV